MLRPPQQQLPTSSPTFNPAKNGRHHAERRPPRYPPPIPSPQPHPHKSSPSPPLGRPIKKLPPTIEVDLDTATADTIYTLLASKISYPKSQLRITKGQDGTLIPLGDLSGVSPTLKSLGLRDSSTIHIKDLGPQVGWRTTFITEYLGPIFIHPAFLLLRDYLYSDSAMNPLSYIPGSPAKYARLKPERTQ